MDRSIANTGAKIARARQSALFTAVRSGDVHEISPLLAAGVPVEGRDERGRTALMVAAEAGQTAAFHALVQAGADLHAVSLVDSDVLEAAAGGGNIDLVRYLLDRHLPVDGRGEPGETGPAQAGGHATALICAALSGHLPVVRLLVGKGANLNAKFAGETALTHAQQHGHQKIVAYLSAHGAKRVEHDPALAEVACFREQADRRPYRDVVEMLTGLCGDPQGWKPEPDLGVEAPGVFTFTFRKTPRAVKWFRRKAATKDDPADSEILDRLMAETRQLGFQLVMGEPWHEGETTKLVLFPTADKFAVVAAMGVNGVNLGFSTSDIVEWLRDLERTSPFELSFCGHDFLGGDFPKPIAAAKRLAGRMAKLCPSLLDDECATTSELANLLKNNQSFFLRWD